MIKNIPYYLIESFLAAAEEPSFQLAADKLSMTQSTLSKQMILIESLLPHKVFTFVGRKKVLTDYGKSLFEALKPKFAQTQEIIHQTSILYSNPENLHLKIGGRGELLDILAIHLRFIGKMTFLPMNSDDALNSVLQRNADLAIVHTVVDSAEIVIKPFLANSFKLVISKKLLRSLPHSESELAKKLKSFPCLIYKTQDPVMKNILKSWKMNESELHIHRVYPNYTTLANMVQESLGWTILPSHIQINETQNHIIPASAGSAFNKTFYICYRKDISKAPWNKELQAALKEIEKRLETRAAPK